MKVVREYRTERGKLICHGYILFDEDDEMHVESLDEVKLQVCVDPSAKGDFLRVVSGESISMSLALNEVLHFCETLKKMYDL